MSAISTLVLDSIANVSAGSPTTGQVLQWNSAAAQWVASTPAGGPGGGSVTSAEFADALSAITVNSAALTSVASIASAAASAVSAAVSNHLSLVSDVGRISTLVAAGLVSAGPIKRVLAGDQVVSGTAPESLSGFTFTVSAGVGYGFEFGLGFASPAVSTAGMKLVLSAPSGNFLADFVNGASPAAVQRSVVNATNMTVAYVTVSTAGTGSEQAVYVRGYMKPSGAGTMALALGNNVSGTAGSAIIVRSGSYGYVWRMG